MTAPEITIPREALEAAELVAEHDGTMEECCLAMLKHWPGMWHINAVDFESKIILPLPQETSNEPV